MLRLHMILGGLWLAAGALASLPAQAQVANNPGYDRPGLGFTPAVLQAGRVTWEQGLPDWSRADGATLYNGDAVLRLGLGHALELQLGTGWNRLAGTGLSARGRADTSVALKYAPAPTGKFSWGLLGSMEFTDGAKAFRADRRQYLLGASFNWQHSPRNAWGLSLQVAQGDGSSRLLAVNDGWALTPALNAYVELAQQHMTGAGSGSLGGVGIAWQATPRLQLDVGIRRRLAGHADDWQGGTGVAYYIRGLSPHAVNKRSVQQCA